jgi:lysophospholipid acyltransferase (LPLAT)-like uncharacterized protein
MKLRHPSLIRVASWLTACALRPWLATLRADIDSGPSGPHPADPTERRHLYVFWHEGLLSLFLFRRYPGHVLISQHADGELIAQTCGWMGVSVVRGSSRKGGAKAILQMYRLAQSSHLVITPDGPRGPRRQLHRGVVQLASHVGLSIVPVGVGFGKAWRANSWDRFAVPLPFSKIYFRGGPSIEVPPKLNDQQLEQYRLRVEQALLDTTAWAEANARGEAYSLATTDSQPNPVLDDATQASCEPSSKRPVHRMAAG